MNNNKLSFKEKPKGLSEKKMKATHLNSEIILTFAFMILWNFINPIDI